MHVLIFYIQYIHSILNYTCQHLHQWIEELKGSAVGNHLSEQHDKKPDDNEQSFKINTEQTVWFNSH